jgi:hypothetical protein
MTPEEQRQQLDRIAARQHVVEEYHRGIDTPARQVDALVRCMRRPVATSPTTSPEEDVGFVHWCDHYSWTFAPKDKMSPVKRFVLYDQQRRAALELIDIIDKGENATLDKSRDVGASWLLMNIIAWMWLFEESFHALVGSRVEKLVDNYNIDSLFGKIDHIVTHLPTWMTQGYDPTRHRKKLEFKHPRGNLITGESSNENFGRGPRKHLVYLDEYAFWECDKKVWTSTASTARSRIATSTPSGEHNQFARLRFSDDLHHLTLHWTQDPHKDLDWYREECKSLKNDPADIAQELDINYRASAGKLALPWMSDEQHPVVIPTLSPDDPSHEGCLFYAGLDYGSNNPSCITVYRVRFVATTRYEIMAVWEYYEPSDLRRLAGALKNNPYAGRVKTTYADPSMWFYNQHDAFGQRGVTSLAFIMRDTYHTHLTPGRRGDSYALEQLVEYTREGRFLICDCCENQIREFKNLRYQMMSDKMMQRNNESEKLVDKDNHSWDALKYFFNTFFNKPASIDDQEPPPPPMGWTAMQQDLAAMKTKKLTTLCQPRKPRRRLFRYR